MFTEHDKACIISFGNGGYSKGVQRLKDSLIHVDWQGDIAAITGPSNYFPRDCPTHQESPYAFKPWMFKDVQKHGYRYVLWCDASVWAYVNPDPVFELIQKYGSYFLLDGWNLGQWSTQSCLEILGCSREEAFEIQLIWALFIGLDLEDRLSRQFLEEWYDYGTKTNAFVGPWKNEGTGDFPDGRVLGHRHDQSVASYLRHDLELYGEQLGQSVMDTNVENPREGTIFLARGGA